MNYEDPVRIIERLLPRIQFSIDGCWEYQGSTDTNGYGLFGGHHAHRIVYSLLVGIIPDKMLVCHHCDNRLCVRPSHLFIGTQTDNMQDMISKGRRGINPNSIKEYCTNGHPRTPVNTYIRKDNGGKQCRVCHKIKERNKRKGR